MHIHDLIDDRRLQLPEGNIFRFAQPNGLPKMDDSKKGCLSFATAREIQQARLEAKRKLLQANASLLV